MVRVASFLIVMAHAVKIFAQRKSRTIITPTDATQAIGNHIIGDSKDAKKFQSYGYGQSIILDAMILAAEKVEGTSGWMSRLFPPFCSLRFIELGCAVKFYCYQWSVIVVLGWPFFIAMYCCLRCMYLLA